MKKDQYFYLDAQHKDHLEVFDKHYNSKTVLNLDGSINEDKAEKAAKRSIQRAMR